MHHASKKEEESMKKQTKLIDPIFFSFSLVFLLVGSYVITILLSSFVLSLLWRWFVEPIIFLKLGFINAIGIVLIIELLDKNNTHYSKDEKDWLSIFLLKIFNSIMILTLGFVFSFVF